LEPGTIEQIDIEETMRTSYLDYAMSVIVARALPDARDGLKPVHRRILYAMHDMGLRAASGYKKSARIVGEVLGKYHPHGDVAVYEAMARMAQDFSMRYPLVDGQGNFGSIDGDPPAAMRYTEARMSAISEEMLTDIHKDTVDLGANFDDTLQEPSVLPSRLPNLLLNGSSGIAVGMATNIAPHNLNELCEAIVYLIDQYAFIDEVTAQDLMQFVRGPDFPTGGLIVGGEEIENAYATGKGRITLRAVTHVEEIRGNRQRIVVTELPYQVNKSNLLERIADLVRDGRIEDITDLRDESDRRGMSIVIELKRGAEPHQVLGQLFKYTQLQMTFGYNCLALVDGTPRTLSLKQALHVYIEHRREVIIRRSQFDLDKARDRAHILEGLRIALDHIEAIIATILDSPDAETARARLSARFALSERQAQAILDMPLRRLAGMERQRIEDEYADVIQEIAYLEDLLANPRKILYLVREDVQELGQKYGDARRTHIAGDVEDALQAHGLVPDVPVLISITRQGYVKRTPVKAYELGEESRAGEVGTHEPDPVLSVLAAGSLNDVLFFTRTGRVYLEKVYQIPEGGHADRGILLRNSIRLQEGEQVIQALPVSDFEADLYLVMVTRQGKVKRVGLGEFAAVRANGVIAFSLDEGDELGWVFLSDGRGEVLLVTAAGKALRFAEGDVRVQGRTSSGVLGIRLDETDRVACAELAQEGRDLVLITENGFGKRTPMSEFPAKGRNTGGVIALHPRYTDQTGPIVSARVVQPDDRLALMTDKDMVLRIRAAQVPESGRSARGQIVMNVHKGDRVSVVAHIQSGVTPQGRGS
jgi:DNA gyrase subunit A